LTAKGTLARTAFAETAARSCAQTGPVSHGECVMKCLEGLILAGITQASMDRLHGLPFTIVEQAVEVLPRRVPLRMSTEARAEAI